MIEKHYSSFLESKSSRGWIEKEKNIEIKYELTLYFIMWYKVKSVVNSNLSMVALAEFLKEEKGKII